MSPDETLMDDIVQEAEADWIEFSDAIYIVKVDENWEADIRALLRRAGPLVVRLVREGRLVPGELGGRDTPFRPWPLSAGAAADRIAAELEPIYLRAEPIVPGEICYFTTPDDPSLAWRCSPQSGNGSQT